MAQTQKKPRKREFPPEENGAIAVAEQSPVEEGSEQPELPPIEEPAKKRQGRPPDAVPRHVTFFERISRIPGADWGSRATIRIYRLDPIIDRTRGSNCKYITVYSEALTEEKIKQDHGSGRYRLYLNYKAPGDREGKELDSVELDILDLSYPPIIPDSDWVDDPRNKKWAWARPAGAPGSQQPAPTNGFLEGAKLANESRKMALEEMKAMQPPVPAPGSATQKSPAEELAVVVSVAEKLAALQAPKENGVFQTELSALRIELAASRERGDKLMMEMLHQNRAEKEKPNGFNVESIVSSAEKLFPLIERLWPAAKEGALQNGARAVRSNMSGWQEFLQPMIPAIVNSPILTAIGTSIMASTQHPHPMPNGAPHQPSVHIAPAVPAINATNVPQNATPNGNPAGNGMNPMIGFLQEIARPMLNHLMVDADGADLGDQFGAFVYDGWSSDPRYDQVLSFARTMGPQQVVSIFQQSPLWTQIAPVQQKFGAFIEAFLKYAPPADEDEGEITDLSEDEERAAHA